MKILNKSRTACKTEAKKPDLHFPAPPFRTALVRWFKNNARDLPWRRTNDPYAIMVSEFMLQQTQVATVIPFFERWMKRFPNVLALAAAPESDVLRAWEGLGYYSRARNLHRSAKIISQKPFPSTLDEIRALPGIGRYTAGAISTFAFNHRTPIVEANITRVISRLFNIHEPVDSVRGHEVLWEKAEQLLPRTQAGLHNAALMELGALICIAGTPKCLACPVQSFCACSNPELLPRKKARAKIIRLDEKCAFVFSRGRVLLEQQTGSRWRGMWKLPPTTEPHQTPLFETEYPFTNHRVRLTVFASSPPKTIPENHRWFSLKDLTQIAMTAPHRRALETLIRHIIARDVP